jgi:hypothetical protein
MNVIIESYAYEKIYSFYLNSATKWKYTWSIEDAHNFIDKICNEAENIMGLEIRNEPIIQSWVNYKVAYSRNTKWYFAYTIENNEIHIQDANHAQNMSDQSFNFQKQNNSKLSELKSINNISKTNKKMNTYKCTLKESGRTYKVKANSINEAKQKLKNYLNESILDSQPIASRDAYLISPKGGKYRINQTAEYSDTVVIEGNVVNKTNEKHTIKIIFNNNGSYSIKYINNGGDYTKSGFTLNEDFVNYLKQKLNI